MVSVVTSVRGLPEVLATLDGSMLTGRIDLDDVRQRNGIEDWTSGLYDAEVTFTYPEGVYGSGVPAYTQVFVQAETTETTETTETVQESDD